jgi:O-succinylbenzoate synthase
MIRARWMEHTLMPHFELGTSKGPIAARTVWYLIAWDCERPEVRGIGEAALFPGHSKEFPADVRTKLLELCADTSNWAHRLSSDLVDVPSVRFAVEQCIRDLAASGTKELFPSSFTLGQAGIPINGLVWMGDKATMKPSHPGADRGGFTTVKMKIGAIGIDDELELLAAVRRIQRHGPHPARGCQRCVQCAGTPWRCWSACRTGGAQHRATCARRAVRGDGRTL